MTPPTPEEIAIVVKERCRWTSKENLPVVHSAAYYGANDMALAVAKELREWLERYAHTKGMNVKSWTEINDIRLQLDGEKEVLSPSSSEVGGLAVAQNAAGATPATGSEKAGITIVSVEEVTPELIAKYLLPTPQYSEPHNNE